VSEDAKNMLLSIVDKPIKELRSGVSAIMLSALFDPIVVVGTSFLKPRYSMRLVAQYTPKSLS